MSGGELFERISNERNRMTEEEAGNYIRQVCDALRLVLDFLIAKTFSDLDICMKWALSISI